MLNGLSLYIDFATGSAMIQLLIGALAGVGIAIKVFWNSIKFKLRKLVDKN